MTCGKEFELQPIRNAYRLTHDTRDSTHKFVLQSFVLLTPRSYVAVDRNVTSNAEQRPLLSDRHSEFRSDLRKTLLAYLSLGGKNREVGNRPRGKTSLATLVVCFSLPLLFSYCLQYVAEKHLDCELAYKNRVACGAIPSTALGTGPVGITT